MALQNVINTRTIDLEEKGSLLNIKEATLTNAATSNVHPIRKGEFDTEVIRLDAAIAASHESMHTYVDTTNVDLTSALAAGSFADTTWTLGASELHIGDVLFLDAATEQDSDRAWLMIAATGADSDFKAFGSDVDNAITTATGAAVTSLTGDASTYTTLGLAETAIESNASSITVLEGDAETLTDLGLVEDKIALMDLDIAGHSVTKEYSVTWGAPVVGVSTASIDTSTDFGTKSVSVRILKDLGDGFFEHISTSTVETSSNATSIRLVTESGSVIAATLVLEVTGVPVV